MPFWLPTFSTTRWSQNYYGKNYTENFSFSRGANSYTYERRIDVTYAQHAREGEVQNCIGVALKNIMLFSRPEVGFQLDGISENGRFDNKFKPTIQETYNLLQNKGTLTESFSSLI